jgi:hypothetical protein
LWNTGFVDYPDYSTDPSPAVSTAVLLYIRGVEELSHESPAPTTPATGFKEKLITTSRQFITTFSLKQSYSNSQIQTWILYVFYFSSWLTADGL